MKYDIEYLINFLKENKKIYYVKLYKGDIYLIYRKIKRFYFVIKNENENIYEEIPDEYKPLLKIQLELKDVEKIIWFIEKYGEYIKFFDIKVDKTGFYVIFKSGAEVILKELMVVVVENGFKNVIYKTETNMFEFLF